LKKSEADMTYEKQLTDPDIYPDEKVLKEIFGEGFEPFLELMALYDKNEVVHEWKYYRDGNLWLCKATKKKKTIAWMSAVKGFMRATIYFPAKYIEGIYIQDISEETKEMIKNTKNTGKSKGCTFEIKTKGILKDFNELMMYKLSLK